MDYKILEDIPHYGQDRKDLERRYMCASLGLFYVKGNGDLMPIAIQFHQDPHHDNPIWTPNDSEIDWICAKLWLRNSDTQFHQVIINTPRSMIDWALTYSAKLSGIVSVSVAIGYSDASASSLPLGRFVSFGLRFHMTIHYFLFPSSIVAQNVTFLLVTRYVKVAEP